MGVWKTRKNLAGGIFGRWRVLRRHRRRSSYCYWLCRCACGSVREVRGVNLTNGSSVSCGCTRQLIPAKDKRAMVEAYQSGLTMRAAGNRFGWSEWACEEALKAAGVARRSRGGRIYAVNERFFSRVDSEEKAYWLGFITADGSVLDRGMLQVGLHFRDGTHLKKLGLSLGAGHPVREQFQTGGFGGRAHLAKLTVHSVKLVADLKALGVIPRKSLVAAPWEGGPRWLLRHYWRGLVDGDGWVCQDRHGYWHVGLCGSFGIVDGFCHFIERETGWPYKCPLRAKSIWSTSYNGLQLAREVTTLLYGVAMVALERKMAAASQLMATRSLVRRRLHSLLRLSLKELLELRGRRGRWEDVALGLGTNVGTLRSARRVLGEAIRRGSNGR